MGEERKGEPVPRGVGATDASRAPRVQLAFLPPTYTLSMDQPVVFDHTLSTPRATN